MLCDIVLFSEFSIHRIRHECKPTVAAWSAHDVSILESTCMIELLLERKYKHSATVPLLGRASGFDKNCHHYFLCFNEICILSELQWSLQTNHLNYHNHHGDLPVNAGVQYSDVTNSSRQMSQRTVYRYKTNTTVINTLPVCMGVGKGGQGGPLDFEIISKERLFFQFRGVKTKFHHFWPPWKNFGKIPYYYPWKKSFRHPCLCANIRNRLISDTSL